MQFSKVSIVICALAMGTTLTIRAEDNPAQAKAREALVSKLFEISEQAPITNPPAAPTVPVVVAPATAPSPVAKQGDEPAMMPVNGDAKAQAKAEKAAKAAELKAQKAAAKAQAKADADKAAADLKAQKAAAKQAADQKAAEVAAAKKQVKSNMDSTKPVMVQGDIVSEPAPGGDTPAQAKARETMAQTLFDSASSVPSVKAEPIVVQPAPAPVVTPAPAVKTVMASTPIGMAPPLPISADKQQKLSDLLAKYKMDQVTPDEYQKQRAAILAEP
ncbi:MAG TPA: hypothetical protein VG347_00395 [Verrucomicrobiae bacterium]|nr:hypothetical protein [Verrucomicrobiae bacterium]